MPKKQPKSRQPKLRKINVSARAQWKQILKDVEKEDIPIDFLLRICVNLIDGTKIDINVKDLIADGHDPEKLEEALDNKFRSLDPYIEDIDFYVDIDDVVRTVQPITDQILKNL
jgi:hypothetical protein